MTGTSSSTALSTTSTSRSCPRSRGTARIPGPAAVFERDSSFRSELPALCRALFVHPADLQFIELRSLMAAWPQQHPP
jgi:hypothetical protein